MSQRSPRVSSDDARRRILEATRELLLDRPFAALAVGDVMAWAGLTRTVFYRHFDPANPREFALLLMAAHRAYLVDTFGGGHDSPERRTEATAALTARWKRLLAE